MVLGHKYEGLVFAKIEVNRLWLFINYVAAPILNQFAY